MPGEDGFRPYWRYAQRVNVSNGNFFFIFAQGSCVTCGGASQGAYPNPRETRLLGPVLIYNGLGTTDVDLGPKWMLPWHAKISKDNSGNATLIDADGTQRYFGIGPASTPQTYPSDTESDVLTSDGTDFTLKRFGTGDRWIFGMSDGLSKRIESRTGHTITLTWSSGHLQKVTDGQGRDTFTWDFEGHMLTGSYNVGLPHLVDTHEWDGDGRRMRAKWANASDWTNFVYDEIETSYPAILAEYTLVSSTFTLKSVNTHGIGLINTNREGTKRYFHFDGLGSTWALTDSSEVVQDTYVYSAFGVQESSTGSSVNPFRYVGQFGYYDEPARGSSLGQRLMGVRLYTPGLGRFLSLDPIPALNRYAYVASNPVSHIDPHGRRRQKGPIYFDWTDVGVFIIGGLLATLRESASAFTVLSIMWIGLWALFLA